MTRTFFQLPAVALFALAACTTPPPDGPGVLALPGSNKSLEQFQKDEIECRQYAAGRLPTGDAANLAWDEMQRRYDFAYIQCMYTKGHKVPVPTDYTGAPAKPPPPSPPAPPK